MTRRAAAVDNGPPLANPDLDSVVVETTTGARPDPLVGRMLDGRYRLEQVVARGGMATVYVAVDDRLDRTVAVKVMHAGLAEDPDFVARFTQEAKAAARLSSADVVAVFDQGRDAASGAAYLVMELVAGRTLRDVVRERAPLTPALALELLEPVLRALAAAHRAGIVHRDVKPENILLGDDGRIKVADFGLARAVAASTRTSTGLLIGTVAYLAPEQVEHGTADPRTDVYAAGIVLWEALTGRPPYSGDSPLNVAFRHVHEDVPPPSSVVPSIPRGLDELVVRATRRDPSARPVDAGAFLAELRAVRDDLPDDQHRTMVVRRPQPQPTIVVARSTPRKPRRRRRWGRVAAVVVVLLALLAVAGGWYLGTGRYTSAPPVLGKTRAAASATLDQAGLRVGDGGTAYDERVAAGLVLRQRPAPNAQVLRGGTVALVLSKGPDRRAVPSVLRSSLDEASAALTKAGLQRGAVSRAYSTSVAADEVISSDPKPGSRLRPGTTVALVVSRGVEQRTVPDLLGAPQVTAETALRKAGFRSTVTAVFSDTVAKDLVSSQTPGPGRAPKGSTVALQVSKGPELVAVPDLRGKSGPDAAAALQALGLTGAAFDLPDGQGRVVTQSPGPGKMVRKGTRVTYYVL